MEEIKQVGIMPTPKEILLKYLDPADNSYLLDKIKELEVLNIELESITGDPKKEAKWKKANPYSFDNPTLLINYNNTQIQYYNMQIGRGLFRGAGRSNVVKTLELYEDKPCVAAGIIENLMGLFIIRGKTKAFAFVVQKGDFWIGGYSYKIGYVSIEDFFKLFETIKNNPETGKGVANIYSQELFEQIKKEVLVKAIQGK